MVVELLNIDFVNEELRKRGVMRKWLCGQLKVSTSTGYLMFRKGFLPEEPQRRRQVVKDLAAYLGVKPEEILVNAGKRKTA